MRLSTVIIILFMFAMAFQPAALANDSQTDTPQFKISAVYDIPGAEEMVPGAKEGLKVVQRLQPELHTGQTRNTEWMVEPNVILVPENDKLRFRTEIPAPRR